jgi:hypothetical protein|tara:strand:+ start:514 stop:837 length:324 start_codon:yes stop_codon:yes gene_type:complete
MRKSFIFISIYFSIFVIVSVPLILNIRINELSNEIDSLDAEVFILERQIMQITLKHNEKYSISSIEQLAKINSYERLEISRKIKKLEIPYKIKNQENEKIAILGFGR